MTLAICPLITLFERRRIGERIVDSKAQLIRDGQQLDGTRPFGYQLGPHRSAVNAPTLIPDPTEQRTIKTMRKMRAAAASLVAIHHAIHSKGFAISCETVRNILASGAEGGAA